MREYVISDKQLATIVLKFGGKMMNYSDGTDFVDYDEVDKYEPVEIHELIRCRDCKHYYEADNYHPKGNYIRRCCNYFDTYNDEVEPDGFCAWGER